MNTPLKVGLIEGRNPLPVDHYIISATIDVDPAEIHVAAYNAARELAKANPGRSINLYIVQQPIVLLAALAGFEGLADVHIFERDYKTTDAYYSRIALIADPETSRSTFHFPLLMNLSKEDE